MSTPEEHDRDVFLMMNLAAAENDGAAHPCVRCSNVFHDHQLEDINDKLFCADCIVEVCSNCGSPLPEEFWWTATWCDECREDV